MATSKEKTEPNKPTEVAAESLYLSTLRYFVGGCLFFAAMSFTRIAAMNDMSTIMNFAAVCMAAAIPMNCTALCLQVFVRNFKNKSKVDKCINRYATAGIIITVIGFHLMAVDAISIPWIDTVFTIFLYANAIYMLQVVKRLPGA